jgi:hypothetical protein
VYLHPFLQLHCSYPLQVFSPSFIINGHGLDPSWTSCPAIFIFSSTFESQVTCNIGENVLTIVPNAPSSIYAMM